MRVSILKLRRPHYFRVRVNPQNCQIITLAFTEICDWREIDETVAAQRYDRSNRLADGGTAIVSTGP